MNQTNHEVTPSEKADKPSRYPPVVQRINKRAGRDLVSAISIGVALFAALLVALFLWTPLLLALVLLCVSLAIRELYDAFSVKGYGFPFFPAVAGALVLPIMAFFFSVETFVTSVGVVIAGLVLCVCASTNFTRRSIGTSIFSIIWVGFLISFVFLINGFGSNSLPHGNLMLLGLLFTVVANDIFAYLSGLKWGKTPIAPKVSPKKSWEGFVGGAVGACIVSTIYTVWILEASWSFGLIFGVLIAVAATVGDFAESMVKRELGVKDMSSLLPGHGGVMDRLDSFLFAIPTAWICFSFVFPLFH